MNKKFLNSLLAKLCLESLFEDKRHRPYKAPSRAAARMPIVWHDETCVGIHRVASWPSGVSCMQDGYKQVEALWAGPMGLQSVVRQAIRRMCDLPSRLGRTGPQARCHRSLPHDGSYTRGVVQEVQHCNRVSK